MSIHSKFLVHWTGNGKADIESQPQSEKPRLYLERLIQYYQDGLWTKRTSEGSIRLKTVVDFVRLCFTEIRLSQVETHAKQYGNLGIGFTRDFIMNKGGRPVIYVPFNNVADGRLLEDSIVTVREKSGRKNTEIHSAAKWIMAHVKRMSNGKSETFKNFEEMEWRLVYDERLNNPHFTKGTGTGIFRLPFEARDVKLIIFPDEDVKQMSLKDRHMKKYFSEHMPIMATLDDCRHF